MTRKSIPARLHLSPRIFRKPYHGGRLTVAQVHDCGKSTTSLEDGDDFVDIGRRSVWESSTESLPSFTNTPQGLKSRLTSPKSAGLVKRWLSHRRNRKDEAPISEAEAPKTAPAHLEPHSRSVPNLTIDPPKLTLEQLAKIDAFYAPTPVLPETPAPRLGKVHPSWSPDIDYTFNPKLLRSTSGSISSKAADKERKYSCTEGFKRLKAPERASDTPESKSASASSFLPPPTSACSEVIFSSCDRESKSKVGSPDERNQGTKSWRHTWVYSPGEGEIYSNFSDDTVRQRNVWINSETPANSFSRNGSLYFTMAESPVAGRGEVTLRFIENPSEGPPPGSEGPSVPASPELL